MMMKILITGGAGYLGCVLTRNLIKNHDVVVYDNLMYNQAPLIDLCRLKNFKFIHSDVRNIKLLKDEVQKSDVIIPLAALVGFPVCENDKTLATDVNYKHIVDIVETLSPNQKILFPNTNSGYGSRIDGEVSEKNKLTPISHYGVTKCDAENYIKSYSNGIIFRLATVFGVSSRMRLDLLVNEFVYKLLTDKYITLFEHEFIRNFIHIQDVSSVFEFMIDNYETYKNEIFNVGLSDTNINKQQLVERIQKQIPDTSVTHSDYFVDPDKRNYIVSNSKIESTGWKPKYSLDCGIEELIEAYKMIVPQESSHYRNSFPLSYGVST
ncbi:MAG: NAD(P)-dependent oxidoreductase [Candidatus Marinimicrobia bacterium]|nr:NAD(P)-dependent oxidoreductase [Candidatus Neomarinimicrobiota bacterium]